MILSHADDGTLVVGFSREEYAGFYDTVMTMDISFTGQGPNPLNLSPADVRTVAAAMIALSKDIDKRRKRA